MNASGPMPGARNVTMDDTSPLPQFRTAVTKLLWQVRPKQSPAMVESVEWPPSSSPRNQGASIHHCRRDCLFSSVNQQEGPVAWPGKNPYGVTTGPGRGPEVITGSRESRAGTQQAELEDGTE